MIVELHEVIGFISIHSHLVGIDYESMKMSFICQGKSCMHY